MRTAPVESLASTTARTPPGVPLTSSAPASSQKYREYNVRENEAVSVHPIGVLGVESHELVEKNVGHRGHAHRGARMARVGGSRGIDLKTPSESTIETAGTRICAASAAVPLLRKGGDSGAAVNDAGGAAGGAENVPRGSGWC
jgi:hypothetical protein